jgi:hypothetical protein
MRRNAESEAPEQFVQIEFPECTPVLSTVSGPESAADIGLMVRRNMNKPLLKHLAYLCPIHPVNTIEEREGRLGILGWRLV